MWSCQNFVFTRVCCKCAGTRNEPWTFKIHQSASISHPHKTSTHSWDKNELVIKKKLNGQCIGSHLGAACSNAVFAHPSYTQKHNSDFKPTVVNNHCVLEVVTQSHKTQQSRDDKRMRVGRAVSTGFLSAVLKGTHQCHTSVTRQRVNSCLLQIRYRKGNSNWTHFGFCKRKLGGCRLL